MNPSEKNKREKEKQEKFIELFSVPFQNLKKTSKKASDNILNSDETVESGLLRKIEVPTEEHEPSIFYYEVDGKVDSIEFVCSCGKKVKVRLKYEQNSADKNKESDV